MKLKCLLTALACVAVALPSQAFPVYVAPTVQHNGFLSLPFDTPIRQTQFDFSSSTFSALGSSGGLLTEIDFGLFDGGAATILGNPTVGVTSVNPDSISSNLSSNVSGPMTQVTGNSYSLVANTGNNPSAFSVALVFSTPFFYDPSQGNLLLYFSNSATTSGPDLRLDAFSPLGSTAVSGITYKNSVPDLQFVFQQSAVGAPELSSGEAGSALALALG